MSKKNDNFFKEKKIWSKVKDELLGCYLTPYFNKILFTRKPTIYIDGFAGKGKFEDGENGSPLTALECLRNSQSQFRGQHTMPQITMKFIELNHAGDLINNLRNVQNQSCEVIAGRFEERVIPLLKGEAEKSRDQNVFLYIDPYGVKALDASLFDALPDVFNSAELLINFNSWGFLRMAFALKKTAFREEQEDIFSDIEEYDTSTANTIEELNAIAGGDYWQPIVDRYNDSEIDGYQAEKLFSHMYKLRLRKKYAYVLDMPIRLKSGHHPKYRMVFATNHPEGCILMADNIYARTDRLVINIQKSGQMSLFDETAENEIIYPEVLLESAKKTLDSLRDYTRLNVFLASFYNEHGVLCNTSKLCGGQNSILKELESSGYIDVKRVPETTATGKPSRSWQDGRGKTVEIKKRI